MTGLFDFEDETVLRAGQHALLTEIREGRPMSGSRLAADIAGEGNYTAQDLVNYGRGLSVAIGEIVGNRCKTQWQMAGKLACEAEFIQALKDRMKTIENSTD